MKRRVGFTILLIGCFFLVTGCELFEKKEEIISKAAADRVAEDFIADLNSYMISKTEANFTALRVNFHPDMKSYNQTKDGLIVSESPLNHIEKEESKIAITPTTKDGNIQNFTYRIGNTVTFDGTGFIEFKKEGSKWKIFVFSIKHDEADEIFDIRVLDR